MSWNESKTLPTSSAREGSNEQSFEALVASQYDFIWRVLRGFGLSRSDAEDAAQQVFMIAARKFDAIAPDKARSFVYGTAMHVASNARRGLRRRREVPSDEADRPEHESRGPERTASLEQARALLGELLRELPEKQRRVLVLAELEQLEVPEIAALERIPVGTAASRLRLARKQFRELLDTARDRNPFLEEP